MRMGSTDCAVALVRVAAVRPRFNDDESWINTEAISRVEEVLDSDVRSMVKGTLISIRWEGGGEAIIEGVRVRAGWPLSLKEGGVYLAFLARRSIDPWWFVGPVLGVERGILVDSAKAAVRPDDPLTGLPLPKLRALVREGAKVIDSLGTLPPP